MVNIINSELASRPSNVELIAVNDDAYLLTSIQYDIKASLIDIKSQLVTLTASIDSLTSVINLMFLSMRRT